MVYIWVRTPQLRSREGVSGTKAKNFDSGSGSAGTGISGRKKAAEFVIL